MAGVRDQILKWITRAVSLEGLPELDAAVPGMPGTQTLRDVQARHVLRVLKACGGNKSHAARALGIDRRSLYRRIAWAGEVLKRGEADDEPGRIEDPGAVSTKPPAG
jgi:DNA-binding NtrC family response regulator